MISPLDGIRMAGTGSWNVEFDATQLMFGAAAVDRLGEVARGLGCGKVLLVTDRGLRDAGHVNRALAALRSSSVESLVYDDVEINPTSRHVEDGARLATGQQIDGIVGLGGGSALDTAKGVNFVLTNGGNIEDYWGSGKATGPMLPSIGIPTTAGTGTDAQSYALISRADDGTKMACGDRKARFRAVLLDPSLACSVPRDVAAVSGIDALSHVIESYVSTRANPISRLFAVEAWRLLESTLETVLSDLSDESAWGRMLLGSHLAGASIEHAMLGAAHACANPLTARFGITHGIAVGLMLPEVMRLNESQAAAHYAELYDVGVTGRGGNLIQRFEQLREAAGLATRIGDYPVPRDCLSELAADAAQQWTAGFNPAPVGLAELQGLYEAAY